MRHCSVQVRGLLTRSELDRYNALMEVGKYLESQTKYDLVYTVQKEVDLLIQPAIERLKDKGRQRDRDTEEFLKAQEQEDQENNDNTILDGEEEPKDNLDQETKPNVNKINETQREIHYTIDQNPVLKLKVKAESCWIRVIVDNLEVTEETLYEGNERQWTGDEKIHILAGNPKAIQLNLSGIEIDTSYNKPYNFIFEKIE